MFEKKRSLLGIAAGTLIGIVILLLAVWGANRLISVFDNGFYTAFVQFFNESLFLLVLIVLVSFIADVTYLLVFPINAPAPVFKAASGVMAALFVFRLMMFIGESVGVDLSWILTPLAFAAYVITAIAILLLGYWEVFKEAGREEGLVSAGKKHEGKKIMWKDVGEEFREALYNIGARFRKATEPRKKLK